MGTSDNRYQVQGPYLPTILQNILCLFFSLQKFVKLKLVQILTG